MAELPWPTLGPSPKPLPARSPAPPMQPPAGYPPSSSAPPVTPPRVSSPVSGPPTPRSAGETPTTPTPAGQAPPTPVPAAPAPTTKAPEDLRESTRRRTEASARWMGMGMGMGAEMGMGLVAPHGAALMGSQGGGGGGSGGTRGARASPAVRRRLMEGRLATPETAACAAAPAAAPHGRVVQGPPTLAGAMLASLASVGGRDVGRAALGLALASAPAQGLWGLVSGALRSLGAVGSGPQGKSVARGEAQGAQEGKGAQGARGTQGAQGPQRAQGELGRGFWGLSEVQVLRDPCGVRGPCSARGAHCHLVPAVIQAGDTLAQLAAPHRLTIRELQRLNGFESDNLYQGETVHLPSAPVSGAGADTRPGLRRTRRVLLSRPSFVQPPCLCSPANPLVPGAARTGPPHPHSWGYPPLRPGPEGGGPPAPPAPRRCRCLVSGLALPPWPTLTPGSAQEPVQPKQKRKGRGKQKQSTRIGHIFRPLHTLNSKHSSISSSSSSSGTVQGRWTRFPRGFSRLVDGWRPFSAPVLDRAAFLSSAFGPRWGRMHEGVDVAAEEGVPVLASAPGRVAFAGAYPVYGNLVEVDHGAGFLTRYAHCQQVLCLEGQVVARGQLVALVGAAGRAFGPHLHFEVRRDGEALPPLKWCNM